MKCDGAIWLFHPTGNSLSATQLNSKACFPATFSELSTEVVQRNPLSFMYAEFTVSDPNVPVPEFDTRVVVIVGTSLLVSLK